MALVSIRHELGRYTRYGSQEEEFYDTTLDPHEWTNQIDRPEYADTVKKLRALVPSFKITAQPLPSALTKKLKESEQAKKMEKKK